MVFDFMMMAVLLVLTTIFIFSGGIMLLIPLGITVVIGAIIGEVYKVINGR